MQAPWPSSFHYPLPAQRPDARLRSLPADEAPRPADLAEGEAPDWVRELARKYKLRVIDWTTQSWALLVAPHRFMEEWASGRREALAPTRFYAFGTAITVLVQRVGMWICHTKQVESTWWRSAMHSVFFSIAVAAVMGACTHLLLRKRSKAPLRATVAAQMFTTAGPQVFLVALGWLVSCVWFSLHGSVPMVNAGSAGTGYEAVQVPIPASLGPTIAYGWSVAALAGVHRVRWWRALLAMLGGIVILAFGAALVISGGLVLWKVAAHR